MGIYVELARFAVRHPELPDSTVWVLVKGVPDFVEHTGEGWDWLPPPVAFDPQQHVREWRAVLLVPSTADMDEYRFTTVLACYTGQAWWEARVERVLHTIEDALADGETQYIGWSPTDQGPAR